MLDGLNFKEYVAFLSAFSPHTSLQQKIECGCSPLAFPFLCYSDLEILFKLGYVRAPILVIFRVYDTDCNGKVAFDDILNILRDLTGSFMTEQQRQVCVKEF
jgi:serine/threonine-protein phosphatase 2B regulatory subunit